jgi:hypothetical protein
MKIALKTYRLFTSYFTDIFHKLQTTPSCVQLFIASLSLLVCYRYAYLESLKKYIILNVKIFVSYIYSN